jgi:hypothetical protein
MRVYHFLSAKNALDDLRKRQIKLSEIDKLNDPFELWCSAQGDRRLRAALRRWKEEIAQRFGILCFCKRWHNPVLWSHYADSHRGMSLGFEVDEGGLKPVSYLNGRPPLQLPPTQERVEELLYTKYRDWSYEEELRCWFSLEEREASTGLHFYSFDEKVQLREVIAGPLCDTPKATIDAALKGYGHPVRVIKARLAFTTFQIIENRQGFRR